MEYKETLNLPKTSFKMKGNLSNQEPIQLKEWADNKIYERIKAKSLTKKKFILHDGPPYANGNIHLGTALNKILKDIIIKAKRMDGFNSHYVPGWDCHGLPIEHNVDKELGKKKHLITKKEIRQKCREYAEKYVNIQKEDFKRLGIFGEWDAPYLTMNYPYEAKIAKECSMFALNGLLFRDKKPIHWCPSCKTALAEAEIEYENLTSPSIFVKFLFKGKMPAGIELPKDKKVYIVIWTTTPWTIPANLAVCLNPDFVYSLVLVNDEIYIVAKELVEKIMQTIDAENYEILSDISPKELENQNTEHPLYKRDSIITLGNHVTLEAGTGCVHTAPGHGHDDYHIGLKYGLDIYSPIKDNGTFEDDVKFFGGEFAFKSNDFVIQKLKETNALLKTEKIVHSYPHCWRCKRPVMFRATKQWFISMEKKDLRKKALTKIDEVKWIPSWGRNRIYSMIENRPDWCVSRQRVWGVPITIFVCKECDTVHINEDIIENIYNVFKKYGSDAWLEMDNEHFLKEHSKCINCGSSELVKEKDILDVWFDSGVSHSAVLQEDENLSYPADLYLEGSDQHRGWFHSSLLTSVGNYGKAPYKAVLTHGFVVDGSGKKMSKSIGNVILPKEVIKKFGAEILRLWVSSADYREDIKVSDLILNQLSDIYRKIRNTARYMLGNLYDFKPDEDKVDYEELQDIDKFILCKLNKLTKACIKGYQDYEFHVIYHKITNFCTVDLSSFYLDIIKDRLYVTNANSKERRGAQTAMFYLLQYITKIISPILTFTAEEIWKEVPFFDGKKESVHLEDFSYENEEWANKEIEKKWDIIFNMRKDVTKALEQARDKKIIGHPLDASVSIFSKDETNQKILSEYEKELKTIFIVSSAKVDKNIEPDFKSENGLMVKVGKAEGKKCERCWIYDTSVGENKEHSTICNRCYNVIKDLST